MDEAQGFSLDVINEVRRAIDESNISDSEIIEKAEMSRDYFYKRMRGEKPFNTNDISKIADVLGVDAFLILRRAATSGKRIRPRDGATVLDAEQASTVVPATPDLLATAAASMPFAMMSSSVSSEPTRIAAPSLKYSSNASAASH